MGKTEVQGGEGHEGEGDEDEREGDDGEGKTHDEGSRDEDEEGEEVVSLSKKRNADRMRKVRLHGKKSMVVVQPGGVVEEEIPIYDSRKHGPGTLVRMPLSRGIYKVMTVPRLDADGNPIW